MKKLSLQLSYSIYKNEIRNIPATILIASIGKIYSRDLRVKTENQFKY